MIKSSLFRSICIAAFGLAAVPAMAEIKYEYANGLSTRFYGQFDPAFVTFDDGVSSTSEIADNSSSNSRVGLWVRNPIGASEFSFNFETALGLRPSAGLSQNFTPDAFKWRRTNIRKVDFSLKTERMGRFSIGQGSMATDGVAENDLSGTTLVTYSSIGDVAGGFRFRTTAGVLSTKAVGAAMRNFDGARRGRIRYDTPDFNGFTVSASYGENILVSASQLQTTDIALRYAGDAGRFKVRGAVGYSRTDTGLGTIFNDSLASFSMLHDSGFNVTVAAGNRSTSGNYGYGKLGYKADWFAVGGTALSVDYYRGNDLTVAGSKSTAIGFGAVQKFDAANIEAYLGYRDYRLSEIGTAYLDASSLIFGARWKF